MTLSEVSLWNEIKNGRMLGYDFDRQRPIGNYIVDFYCKDLQLAIEVDGITHEEKAIAERSPNAYLLNITIFYDKKYFEGAAHQRILKKMGFVK